MVDAAATMATSEGPLQTAMRNCATAKVTPATRMAGQTSIMAAKAGEGPDEPEGDEEIEGNKNDGGGAGEREEIEAGDAVKSDEGNAHGSEGDGSGVGEQRESGGLQGTEAETDEDGAADGDGRAEAGGALKERAEREGDEEKLQAAVGGDAGEALLQSDEARRS